MTAISGTGWLNHGLVEDDGTISDEGREAVGRGIKTLATAVSNTAHSHGWWSDDDGNPKMRNFGEMVALMHSELSEALEAWREGDDITKITLVDAKPEGVASEFADVIIRILDTCQTMGIPIEEALLLKNDYNRTRPYRHGGKLA